MTIAHHRTVTLRTAPRRRSILSEILLWNAAWRECRRLHRLSPEALADMGLTAADRASVTISAIVARMRG